MFLRYIKFIYLQKWLKEENIRSESYYPDSTYYLDQDNIHKEAPLSEEQISNKTNLNGQIAIGLLQKEQMEG